ncbi:MAG: DUF2161 family putative PD-(D/E)XK-type phosphodiesterase [Sulfobacillus sp.]
MKCYLENQGYTVRSEVRDCDVVACKDDHVVVVELKRTLTTYLLIQAIDRQKAGDAVYVAVPRPKRPNDSYWRGVRRLLQRLELGLLFVYPKNGQQNVRLVQQPTGASPRASAMKKRARHTLLEEFHARSSDHNAGGSTGQPLVTAYRERAVRIARVLREHGAQSTRQLRALHETGEHTTAILYRNVYGWFAPVRRGVYDITDKGRTDLDRFHFIDFDQRIVHPPG